MYFQLPPQAFRPELGIHRHQGPFHTENQFLSNREAACN